MMCYTFSLCSPVFESIDEIRSYFRIEIESCPWTEIWEHSDSGDMKIVGHIMNRGSETFYRNVGKAVMHNVEDDGSLMSEAEMDREMKKHNAMTRRG